MSTEKIYDFIVISGIGNELKAIDIDDSESITYAMELLFVPEILMIVPQEAKPQPVLEKFLQPREGVRLHAQKQVPSFHEFVLTGLSGGQLYGFSVTEYPQFNKESYLALRELFKSQGRDKGIPDTLHSGRTLAIISKYPYHKTFMNILKTFMKSLPEGWKFNKKIALDLSLLLDKVQIPKPELIPKPLIFNKINFGSFPLIPDEKHLPLSDNDFDTLFTLLSIENIIIIFSALMQERKLIFISRSLEYLTPCIFSLLSLLYPFSWPYPLIPILPSDFIEVFESPMPYILGCLSSVLELCFPDGDQMVIDLDSNHIISTEPIVKLPPRIHSKLLKKLKNNCNLFKSPMKSLRISPLSGISSIGEKEYEHDFEYTSFSSSSFSFSGDEVDENNKDNDQKEKKVPNGTLDSEKISSNKNTKVVKNENSRKFFKYRRNPFRLRKTKSNSPFISKNRKQKSLSSFSPPKVEKTELRKTQSFHKNKKHKSVGSLNQITRMPNVQRIDTKNNLKVKKNQENGNGKKKEKEKRKRKRNKKRKQKKNRQTEKKENNDKKIQEEDKGGVVKQEDGLETRENNKNKNENENKGKEGKEADKEKEVKEEEQEHEHESEQEQENENKNKKKEQKQNEKEEKEFKNNKKIVEGQEDGVETRENKKENENKGERTEEGDKVGKIKKQEQEQEQEQEQKNKNKKKEQKQKELEGKEMKEKKKKKKRKKKIIIPKNEEEFMNNKIFNDEEFLETAPEDCIPLLEKFITSQMFTLYIEEQITNKTKNNSNDYFLNLIKEKLEKKYQDFIKYQNLSYSGWMKKKTNNRLKNWKNRYFILKDKQLYSSHKMITNKNNKLQQVPIFQGRSKIVIPNMKLYEKEKEKFKDNFYKMNIITIFEKNKKKVEKTLELATETQMLQKKWVKFLKFICLTNDEIQFLSKYKKMYGNETKHLRKVRTKTIVGGINLNKIFEEKEENVVTIGNLSCKIGFSTDITEESGTDYEKIENEKLFNK
ncbi:receptor mediated endocytosis [Anaeramoeba flamelloides]|uniref:Receptor mediated endocytosis n=1 Tax=Anaeramoeba flamelloides TaxID=1746091 RepID=A0ABQ8YI20_9EUKA|nr:receptor mediated endocytosis [Anaeramoeba flamelloides]